MVSSSKVRIVCPSISFLFTRLRGSLRVFPYLENFVFEGSSLSVALADLLPLLHQSIDWFEGLMRERGTMSEVRSSELKIGLSSNDDPARAEVDTTVSNLREVRAFSALGEKCSLDIKTLSRFSQRFQFLERVRVRLPHDKERAYHFSPGEVCFYKAAFLYGLRFPIHPFIMELLNHFNIASGQLMPNS